jgi:hypothetical protein
VYSGKGAAAADSSVAKGLTWPALCHLCAVQLNLFLAVLKTKFAKAKNLLDEKRRQRRAMKAGRGSKKRNVLARATGWMKRECLQSVACAADTDNNGGSSAGCPCIAICMY